MSEPTSAIDLRVAVLRGDAGLSEAEGRLVRALAVAFRDGLEQMAGEVPPSRRGWAEFWEGKQEMVRGRVSRTGRELLGLTAGPEEEDRLAPEGRLIAAGIVRILDSQRAVAICRYGLSAGTARQLLGGLRGVDAKLLETALTVLDTPSPGSPNPADAPQPGANPLEGARRMGASFPPAAPPSGSEPAKRPGATGRRPDAAEDPEATPEEALFEVRAPEIGFDQVFLPAETLREIRTALVQIRKHPLLVERWGLGERYRMGRGLAFNFAGPAGTGKTLTAEAVAKELGRALLTVKYSGLESKWIGETGKHIAAVFAAARRHEAVLFFDEADAIASRRTANLEGSGRHYNLSVNILLHEMEQYDGVVVFATNLAANFDPAFERRIQSHVLFRIPETDEREKIWQAHLPPRAPLAPDVDLRALAEEFAMAGGDIRNAVLKAVRLAALDDAPDDALQITQEHLLVGARAVLDARVVMAQSILKGLGDGSAGGSE